MKGLCASLLILFSVKTYAATNALSEFYSLYKSGQYQKAIISLEKITDNESLETSRNYLLALSHSRLQEYDQAVLYFEKALGEQNLTNDIYYEYGQALYANNNLKKSRDAFQKSADQKFNKTQSLYYVGHISQILEDFQLAKRAYQTLIKDKEIDQKLEQVAKFQFSETSLSILRINESNKDKQEAEVKKSILPMLNASLDIDPKSMVAPDIEKRIKEVQKEFNLDPNLLKNGRRLSPKKLNAYFDLKTKFDDNVTNTNLENDIQQSHKESFIIEAESEIKYEYVFKKQFISTPTFRININKYSNQDDETVYQNDANVFTGSLNNKWEHLLRNSPASLIFNFDISKTFKDYQKIHSKDEYSTAKTITIGEQASFTTRGDTTFKFKYKDYTSYTETLNNHTISYSVDQSINIFGSQLLIILLEADLTNNYNNTSTNTNSYMLRFDYLIPEFIPKYTLTASLTTTINDTLELKSTRGFETTINPSLEITKDLTDKLKGIVSFDYTNNKSKSTDYTYQKFVTNMELKYSF